METYLLIAVVVLLVVTNIFLANIQEAIKELHIELIKHRTVQETIKDFIRHYLERHASQ